MRVTEQEQMHNLKKKVIGVTSDVLSLPAKYRALRSKTQADKDVSALKLARSYDKAPSYEDGTITRAGMARSLAQDVRDRLKGK